MTWALILPGAPRLTGLRGERRLQKSFFDMLKDGVNSIGEVQGGQLNMKTGFKPDQANDQQGNTFFNLNNPREHDNFAWDWEYQVRTLWIQAIFSGFRGQQHSKPTVQVHLPWRDHLGKAGPMTKPLKSRPIGSSSLM